MGEESPTNVIRAKMEVTASRFSTPWLKAVDARFTANWMHSLTNPIPISGTGELRLSDAITSKASAGQFHIQASVKPQPGPPTQADPGWAWWAGLEPYYLDWDCHLENFQAQDFKSSDVAIGGNWSAPDLTVTNLHTEMYQGRLTPMPA